MENFDFSEKLRDKVESSLIDRIADAITNDRSTAADMVRYGYPAVAEMTAQELMDEYANWHGLYDGDDQLDNIEDGLFRKMLKEINDAKFEEEVEEVLSEDTDDSDSDNTDSSNSIHE